MDCAEYAISLDTLLAKRLIPTKCWHTTALVIADGLRWIRNLTRHFVSQACKGDWYWNGLTLLAKRLIPTKCWYLFLDDCKGDWHWNGLTLLAEWLKPTKCWHTTALVIADGLRWLHYLTRHFVSQACKGDWYWNEIDTVSQAIETYEVLTHNRKGDSQCWIRNLTRHFVSQAIETYEVLTHNRKGDSQCWIRNLTRHFVSQACKGDWYWNEIDTVSRVIETYEVLTYNRKGDSRWTALIALSHSTHC